MRKLLLILLFCFGVQQLRAQDPDPNLFRTWYLYEMQLTDADPVLTVANYQNPTIDPYITILNTLEYSGIGSCNSFMGIYDVFSSQYLESSDFTSTSETCPHAFFETSFFFLVQSIEYNITQDSNGFTLHQNTPLGGYAIYKDYELSVSENELSRISITPNPVSEALFISSEETLQSITIYNIAGQMVLSETEIQNQIDVSKLAPALYFAEFTTSEGKSIQKIIKK